QGLGVMNLPTNQVLDGIELFLSLFKMQPVLGKMKSDGRETMTKEKIKERQEEEKKENNKKENM
ncbi:flagellar biosynthesis protein flip, partial [Bacillus cereus]|nr:flagellar biosynthesis protein flip [Bacillus cereus]